MHIWNDLYQTAKLIVLIILTRTNLHCHSSLTVSQSVDNQLNTWGLKEEITAKS